MPAPAAALVAEVFGWVELAARALADQTGRVGMAGQAVPVDKADPAGTVARADQAGTVVDIAGSRAETPSGACSP